VILSGCGKKADDGQSFLAPQSADAEKIVRHTGRAKPYHVSLPSKWNPATPQAVQDLAFRASADLLFNVTAGGAEIDVANHPEQTANLLGAVSKNGKILFTDVRLVERGAVTSSGREWVWGIITAQASDGSIWLYTRACSRSGSTFVLTGASNIDNPTIRSQFWEIMDSFEWPN